MKGRFSNTLIFQILALVVVGSAAGFLAIVLFGAIGGVAVAVTPEFSFGLVKDVICPDGELEYYAVQRSYHEPGESEPHLECVENNEVHTNVLLPGIGSVLGLSFLAVFLLVFCPGALIALIVPPMVLRAVRGKKKNPEGSTTYSIGDTK